MSNETELCCFSNQIVESTIDKKFWYARCTICGTTGPLDSFYLGAVEAFDRQLGLEIRNNKNTNEQCYE